MKKLILPSLAAVFAVAISHAAPSDDVSAAAKKLADAANYTWSRTTENAGGGGSRGGFGGGPMTGMTEKDGYTITTRQGQNGSLSTVRKGDSFATQNFQSGEWMSAEEMRQQFAGRGGGGGGGGGAGGGRGRGGFGFGGGNQMNPAEEVAALVKEAKDLKSADGAISGDLTDEAVAARLSFGGRGGQAPAAPKNAMGSVKFWVKDGMIAKYEVHVKGTVAGRNGEMERDTTTTTEIKDVGTTKVEVPDGAKKKLGA